MRDEVLVDHVKKFESGLGQKIPIEKFNEALSHHICADAIETSLEVDDDRTTSKETVNSEEAEKPDL